jgi:hypothetical protein
MVCERFGAVFVPTEQNLKVGISENVRQGVMPINGLRHLPEGDTTGWYIWAGNELPDESTFFQPLHVEHLSEWAPKIIQYLGLAPGWRFLITDDYEDVWFDKSLIINS